MKQFLFTAYCLLLTACCFSQQYYLRGVVVDEGGKPLPNVSIVRSNGYMYYTGNEGGYGLLSATKKDTLQFFASGYERVVQPVDAAVYSTIKLKKQSFNKTAQQFSLSSLTHNLKFETQRQWFTGDETYASTIENNFINPATYPSTGIALNVDRASYSNIRRFITQKQAVPPDAVRLEEMINYFNFGYTEPLGHKLFEVGSVITRSPWTPENFLLFASVKSKKLNLDSLPPSHLTFLIDISGSMDMPNRLPLIKSGLRSLVYNLRAKDSVSLVVYGGTVGIMLPTTSGKEKEKIFGAIDSLQPGGSTPGESGIKLAYGVAARHFIKGGNNRVILATDGDFNVGLKTDAELEELIQQQQASGIYLTCLGVGMGNYKDSKIGALAQKGNGNFAYIDNYAEAEKVLLKEFTQTLYAVADDVYLTATFNPQYVKGYRLIGYDNKVGALKDSTTIMAGGEVGSAYSTLILFELTPQASLRDTANLSPVRFALKYKLPGQHTLYTMTETPQLALTPLSKLSPVYSFAASVALFGQLLRESRFVKEKDFTDVLQLARPSADAQDASQMEFMRLVEEARVLYGGKKKRR